MAATTSANETTMAQTSEDVGAALEQVSDVAMNGQDAASEDGAATTPCEAEKGPSNGAATKVKDKEAKAKDSPRQKKKEDKSIEHILKALNSLETPEEKLAALCKKYADLHEEHRLLQVKFKQSQKKLTSVIREKDQLQTEHSKSVLAKSKLESLCRELQRHNKLVKEESLARAREEEEKRKEVTNKFQTTIGEIQAQMNDHYAKNTKLREENLELANKLKGLIDQYEEREQHIDKVLKHKDLEQQLVDARLAQSNLQLKEEQEKNLTEKQLLLQEASDAHKKISVLEEQEKQLRAQVALYAEKYEEFQQTLAKSNEVFQSFKTEMDKMTKKIKKLEKETTMWRSRWENSNKALLEMAEEKTRSDKEIQTMTTKIKKLESLCRALQQERHKPGDGSALAAAVPESLSSDTPMISDVTNTQDAAPPLEAVTPVTSQSPENGISHEDNPPTSETQPSLVETSQQGEELTEGGGNPPDCLANHSEGVEPSSQSEQQKPGSLEATNQESPPTDQSEGKTQTETESASEGSDIASPAQ